MLKKYCWATFAVLVEPAVAVKCLQFPVLQEFLEFYIFVFKKCIPWPTGYCLVRNADSDPTPELMNRICISARCQCIVVKFTFTLEFAKYICNPLKLSI